MQNIKTHILGLLLLLGLLIVPSIAQAVVTGTSMSSLQNKTLTGAIDASTSYWSQIDQSISRWVNICGNSSVSYTLARIDYVPVATLTGRTRGGPSGWSVQYLFESGVQGFDFTVSQNSPSFNLNSILPSTVPYPAPPITTTVWQGRTVNNDRIGRPIQAYWSILVYRNFEARPLPGVNNFPQQLMAQYNCYDDKNALQEVYQLYSNAFTYTINLSTCVPDSKVKTITMDSLPIARIRNAGNTELINTKTSKFSLKCDPNIKLSFSISDLTDPGNLTTTANLTGDSTAKGVGFAVTRSGSRLKFGPDSPAPNTPDQTKYYVGQVPGTGTNLPMSIDLGFSYVRKDGEEVKAGSAKAIIGITYSYQ